MAAMRMLPRLWHICKIFNDTKWSLRAYPIARGHKDKENTELRLTIGNNRYQSVTMGNNGIKLKMCATNEIEQLKLKSTAMTYSRQSITTNAY